MIKLLKTFLVVCGLLLICGLVAGGVGMMVQGFVTNSWKLFAGGFLVVAVALTALIGMAKRWIELP